MKNEGLEGEMDTTRIKIREFLARFIRNHALRDDEDIFAKAYVSSIFAMELVLFVEKEFGVQVENEDLELSNFKSVDALANFVARKKSGAANTIVPQG